MVLKLKDVIGHREIVQILKNAVQRDRVAHAYLFLGPQGVGKQTVARAFARVLLCDRPIDGDACGRCRSCQQMAHDNHPDLHFMEPAGASIKIEQIRELLRKVQFKPYQAERQVFMLEMAEAMTTEAANCFLKTLEEPGSQSVFLLISHRPYALLPTILSRCQQLQFRPLSNGEVAAGLMHVCGLEPEKARQLAPMAGGSLGRAVQLAQGSDQWPARTKILDLVGRIPEMDKVQALGTAEELSADRAAAGEYLDLLLLWFRDMLVYKYTSDQSMLINQDVVDKLVQQVELYTPDGLVAIIEEIKQARDRVLANANTRLALEAMMLKIYSYGGLYNAS
ncbi:DNA polymerase III, delta prime subunit [Desulfotomaculum nigrificans CO-1-SRB]|uniref:DNA polymerase III subunit delta' n=1 Tax=Desulfotomaculum nigrificans (strain DSM 14880 / VKM B-2319 / CO-1-SRB) TaxID=868595 RepID=F6B3Y1_DESCC|nr:DNA polymerase III, delta prime subunit [Desulfotomaculum nigrificans CO-1-SRB]